MFTLALTAASASLQTQFTSMEHLLARGADANILDSDDNSVLSWEAERGNTDAVRLLLTSGSQAVVGTPCSVCSTV
jgi:ankyrin repeat protein